MEEEEGYKRKKQNVFRFRPFSELIEEIKVSTLRHPDLLPHEENRPKFWIAFDKWRDLDYTVEFEEFRQDIGDEIETLEQIVFRKDEIIGILLKHLRNVYKGGALKALLELTVALSQDLSEDFYPHFKDFFVAIQSHLKSKDTEILEKIFLSYAFLFKYLAKYIAHDIKNVFRLLSSLLSPANEYYIKIFACESFAFLVRRVSLKTDRADLYRFIFNELQKNRGLTAGLGQLLFEVIRGVKEQFHSCAESILKLWLSYLGDKKLSPSLIENCLLQTLYSAANHTVKNHAEVIQRTFCDAIWGLLDTFKVGKTEEAVFQHLNHIMNLFQFWIKFKRATHITPNTQMVDTLVKLCNLEVLPDYCLKTLVDIVSYVIKKGCLEFRIEDRNSIFRSMFSRSEDVQLMFTRRMFYYGMFEKDILPPLLSLCWDLLKMEDEAKNQKVLDILYETIPTLKPLLKSADDIKSFSKIYLRLPLHVSMEDMASFNSSLENFLFGAIQNTDLTVENLPSIYSALICLPHLRSIDDTHSSVLQYLCQNIRSTLMSSELTAREIEEFGFVLCQAYLVQALISCDENAQSCFDSEFLVDLLKRFPTSVSILRLVDSFLNNSAENPVLKDFYEAFSALLPNLSSPYHLARFFSLKILKTLELNLNESNEKPSVFSICFEAESLHMKMNFLRDKLKWIGDLEYQLVEKTIPASYEGVFKKGAVQYLLGMLYVNFKPLWKPCEKILETYAHRATGWFWDVFGPHLCETIKICEEGRSANEVLRFEVSDEGLYYEKFKRFCQPDERADVQKHRLLLWNAMETFPDVVEQKNKIVVPLLLDFMLKEVMKFNFEINKVAVNKIEVAPTDMESFDFGNTSQEESSILSVKRKKTTKDTKGAKKCKLNDSSGIFDEITIEDSDEETEEPSRTVEMTDDSIVEETAIEDSDEEEIDDEAEDEDVSLNESKLMRSKRKRARRPFPYVKTLSAHLAVFAKFQNPKGGFKAKELQILYSELLTHPEPTIQKLAFDCLLTFNLNYINPYKDKFYNILDNRTFRNELLTFALDEEKETFQKEHRMSALSVFMRILYGKMMDKTKSKWRANKRARLCLEFLAGCKPEELKMFFELVFLPFEEMLKDDTYTAVQKIRNNLDITSVVPIRKQNRALDTLSMIIKRLGNLIPDIQPYLLKVLLVILASAATLLEKRDEVLPQCRGRLKSICKSGTAILIQFFETFENYNYQPEEIDAIFDSIVWLKLPALETASAIEASGLLRLFATWSEDKRYHILFAKHHEKSEALTPLIPVMNLYASYQEKSGVAAVVSKIVYKLLCCDSEEEDFEVNKGTSLAINFALPLPDVNIDGVPVGLGTKLLIPYVDKIITRFERTLSCPVKNASSLPATDFNILSKISKFVEDPKVCANLMKLLPPFLMNKRIDSDFEIVILNTIASLLTVSENPVCIVKQLAVHFSMMSNHSSRLALVSLFATLGELEPDFKSMANIICNLNALDKGMIDQPDYLLRLEGHKEALELIKSMGADNLNVDFVKILIYNASFMINKLQDMALRNNSNYFLQQLINVLSSYDLSPDVLKKILYDTLLKEIERGLANSDETARNEFILILSVVLQAWKNESKLDELRALCNEDKEKDFWTNIRHLQVNRKARALVLFGREFKARCENKETISTQYLFRYMIPIVTSCIFDEAFKYHTYVIDAGIEALGCLAHAFRWSQYQRLLKKYLEQLSTDKLRHKMYIRLVVSLLNAFHFETSAEPTPIKENTTGEDPAESTEGPPIKENATGEDPAESTEEGPPIKENATGEDPAESTEGPPIKENATGEDPVEKNNVSIPELDDVAEDVDEMSEKVVTPAPKKDNSYEIYLAIKNNILPLLRKTLMKKSKFDNDHKYSERYYPEDDEILRVPIALAMVKLLQHLPSEIFQQNLPGLFLRMCDFLKSKSEQIREASRNTLIKMMDSLGPSHFKCLLSQMKTVLKKGFQVHVLIYTTNSVLLSLNDKMKPGDLNDSVQDLVEICMNELFGDIAEEKEALEIISKLKEARKYKSYNVFRIVGKYVSEELLYNTITPLKEMLKAKQKHKTMNRVSQCLYSIAQGVSFNECITSERLLIFIHVIIKESLPGIDNKRKLEPAKEPSIYDRPSCLLIPKEPGRSGPPAMINVRNTDHVLVEFGLQVLLFSLKRDKIDGRKREMLGMLDPYISILADCLNSNYIKIITTSLRSLLVLYKFDLPAFKNFTRKIVESNFLLLNKYAAVGMGQGDNFEMIQVCFKLVTKIIRDTSYHKFEQNQLHSLLSYIEQDIYDYTRQGTAFHLLKAILSKQLNVPELRDIMSKVAELSITSEHENVRDQCRKVCLQYMLYYPIGKRLANSISFFVGQLEYHLEWGRMSAYETTNAMIQNFPNTVLKQHSALMFVPLAARLINDDSPACKKMAAECIKALLRKLEHDGRLALFSIPLAWLQAEKMCFKRLGAQILGFFAEIEGQSFKTHLPEILPVMIELIKLAKIEMKSLKTEEDEDVNDENATEVKRSTDENATENERSTDQNPQEAERSTDENAQEVERSTDENATEVERSTDHFLYHILNALLKILSSCKAIKEKELSSTFNEFWGELMGLILYPHVWVRLATSQLFGLLFSSYTIEEITKAIGRKKKDDSIFLNNKQKLRDFTADFCTQLQSPYLTEKIGQQIVRNLVYLCKVLSNLTEKIIKMEFDTVEVSLEWTIRKVCKGARKEMSTQKTSFIKRKSAFLFFAAIAHELGKEKLLPLLETMMTPLCREIADDTKHSDDEMKKCAQEVLDLIRGIVGHELYTTYYTQTQLAMMNTKLERKQDRMQEAVTNPERFAKRKIAHHKRSMLNKKIKRAIRKGKRPPTGKQPKAKKPKLSDMVMLREE